MTVLKFYLSVNRNDLFIPTIKEHEKLIYKIASVYTNCVEDRNDLEQDIIYQLWKSFETFSEKSGISTWIYKVAMNTAIHHLKINKRKIVTVPLEEQLLDFYEPDNSVAEDKWKVFKQHIDELNLLDKGIVILYLENKSYEEISKIIGISVSNVGTRLNRIKEKIKQQILKQK